MQHWQEIVEQYTHVTDRLERGIDPGIFEMVVALNVLGIHTAASCEGHLDHGIAAPWIDIENPEADPFTKIAYRRFDTAEEGSSEARQESIKETEHARLAAKRLHLRERQKLVPYLDRFYNQRSTSYEQRLILNQSEWGGTLRLESQGADCQDVLVEEERRQNLAAYQQEMQQFMLFLKDEYFREA